jgi:hypothetical protein
VTGRFPFLAWLPFLFIPQSIVAQNLYHEWRKKRVVLQAIHDCPKPPNASPAAGSRQDGATSRPGKQVASDK